MDIPRDLRIRLADELKFIHTGMREAKPGSHKLYYFSAAYGEVGRILNFSWNTELALLHVVLQASYAAFNQRIIAMEAQRETHLSLAPKVLDNLTYFVEKLERAIRNGRDDELYHLLQELAELSFLTTGNGQYLLRKGLIGAGL